jgi:hypothetical protein
VKHYLRPNPLIHIPNPLARDIALDIGKKYTKIWRKVGIKLAQYTRTKYAFRISEDLEDLVGIIPANLGNTLVPNKA